MKAAIYKGIGGAKDVIVVGDVAEPLLGPERVLVRVHASGLNRADILQRRGLYPPPPGAALNIPGLEFSGTVQAIGPGVQFINPGQRVFGITSGGAQAELVSVHERLLAVIPNNLSFVEAAAVPEAFIAAADALFHQASLQSGETVLIHTIGSGVGTAALQLAHTAGCRVLGTSRTTAKLDLAIGLGLDVAINTQRESFLEAVNRATHGAGVNVLIDTIGSPALGDNLQALSPHGRLVVLGLLGGTNADIDLLTLLNKRVSLIGSQLRTRPFEDKCLAVQRFARSVVPQLERGLIRPIVARVFSIEELAAAHEYMERDENFGKVVISIRD